MCLVKLQDFILKKTLIVSLPNAKSFGRPASSVCSKDC